MSSQFVNYFFSKPSNLFVEPHGGTKLVNQELDLITQDEINSIPNLMIGQDVISDIVQIAEGVYSPLTGFMNKEEIESVLDYYKLTNGIVWPLPIFCQINEKIRLSWNFIDVKFLGSCGSNY